MPLQEDFGFSQKIGLVTLFKVRVQVENCFLFQLFDSMKAGHWLDEEDYEVDYFPSAKQTRLLRHKSSRLCCSVFKPVQGYVYVSPETNPPAVSAFKDQV